MNKNISEEIIEIGGKEYTLFLNRIGIINWERMVNLNDKADEFNQTAKELQEEQQEVEITDDTNPFEMYSDVNEDELNKQLNEMIDIYVKFYWVALYTHHKLTIGQVKELFNVAMEEYGIEQLSELANQMIETANSDLMKKERKNLKALKSTKIN